MTQETMKKAMPLLERLSSVKSLQSLAYQEGFALANLPSPRAYGPNKEVVSLVLFVQEAQNMLAGIVIKLEAELRELGVELG